MMEDENKIDKIFEDSLNQQVFDIPDDFLSDLNNRLDVLEEKKKKRGNIWWFLTALGFIGIAAVSFYLIQTSNNQKQQNDNYFTETSLNKNLDSLNNTQSPDRQINDSHSNGGKDIKNSQSTAVNENSNDEHNKVYLGINEKSSNLNKSKNVSSKKGKKKKSADISNHQLDVNSSGYKNSNKDFAVGGTNDNVSTISEGKQDNKLSDNGDKQKNKVTDNVKVPQKSDDNIIENDLNEVVDIQPNGELTKKDETPLTVSNNLSSGTNDKPKKEVKSWEKEVQLYLGVGKNWVNEDEMNYMKDNNFLTNQRFMMTPTFGANLNLYKNNYSYSLGVSFNQISEKFTAPVTEKYQKDTVVYEYETVIDTVWVFNDTTQTWGYYLDQYFDTIPQNSSITKTKTELQNFHNRYSWITIPVSFGYKFEFGNYALIPRVGLQFNIGMRKAGRYPWPSDHESTFHDIQKGIIIVKPVQFNVAYMLQVEFRRTFNNWHVFVNPYFKSMLSNAIYVDAIVVRKYSTVGVQAGVGLRF